MWRWTFVPWLACACGRVGFEHVGDAGGDARRELPATQTYLKASNTEASDSFGAAIALSSDGTLLAVGAFNEDSNATGVGGTESDNSIPGSGAVYLFSRSAGAWSQQAYVKASNPNVNDQFGFALALSGDGHTLAVDAPLESSNATGIGGDETNNAAAASGAVYVFSDAGGAWAQQEYLKASNSQGNDQFGFALALSNNGNTLAVSSRQEDSADAGINANGADNAASDAGAVYVFTRTGTTWTEQVYIKPAVVFAGYNFGYSLALSDDGNTLVVGAPFESSTAIGIDGDAANRSASASGAAYVFERVGTVWSQRAYLKASNTNPGDELGWSVAVSGDGSTIAAAAKNEASAATGVGADQTSNTAPDSGAIYVFVRAGASWAQQAYVKAPNTDASDELGYTVSLTGDGNQLVVGAREEDSAAIGVNGNQLDNAAARSGAAYVYVRAATEWMFGAYLKAANTGAGDLFGTSIAVASNTGAIAIGASSEDSAAKGVGPVQTDNAASDSGAAYIFE